MRTFPRVAVALTLGLAALAVVPEPGAAVAPPLVHVMPTKARWHGRVAPATEPITYHGGAVMTGPVHVYAIWYGNWSTRATRRAIVTDFLRHLDSPYWRINASMPNKAGRAVGAPAFTAEVDDPGSQGTKNLTDAQIQSVVEQAITTKALPKDTHGVYLVLTASSVHKTGFLSEYCGWHSYASIGGSTIKFSFVGDPTGPKVGACSPQSVSPNGDVGADAMVSTIAHELDEAVTDPTMRGWRTDHGEENADRCAWRYGKVYKVHGAWANMRLGTRHYLIQTNWLDGDTPHCALKP